MRAPVITLGILLAMLGAYAISNQFQGSADKAMEVNPSQAASPILYETRVLAGSWRGFSKNDVPVRLLVKDVHPEWARVLLAWGEDAERPNPRDSNWTRAKILRDGRLSISYPVHLILTLSEDSHTLVGTTVHADPLASVLLTRMEEEQATVALSR